MKQVKRSVALLLLIAMVLSTLSVAYADTNAARFTDIDRSWAKQNIINVHNKGLMSSTSETLFKPLDKVTSYQALVSIAKMAKASEKYDLAALEIKYKASALDKYSVPANVRKEVAFCLETGIITFTDLSAITANTYLTKQVACIYIGRAFGVVYDPQKTIISLKFTDEMFIIKESKPHINYLINIGVLDAPKATNATFNPDTIMTREVFAKLLDIASDKYKELKEISASTTTSTQPTTQPTTQPSTGSTTTSSTSTNTSPMPTIPSYTGSVEQVIPEYGVIVFQIVGSGSADNKRSFTVADNIQCIIDQVPGDRYWTIKSGDKASIYLKDNKIIKLVIDSKVKKITGVLDKTVITDKHGLVIKNQKGEANTYFVTAKTKITRENVSAAYSDLKIGDNITITMDSYDVTLVNANDSKRTDKGTIEAIIFSRTAPPKAIITKLDGQKVEYYICRDIDRQDVIVEGMESNIYDLRPGMQASIDIENEEVIRIVTSSSTVAENLEGTIKSVNTKAMMIIIEYFDSLQQKHIEKKVYAATAKIGDKKLNQLGLGQLKSGDKILIMGASDIDGITADTVILNN